MTSGGKMRRPMTSAIARAMRLAGVAGALIFAGTVAIAQQGWEPTVSVGPAPSKAPARAPARMAMPKAKPAIQPVAAFETAVESAIMSEDRKTAVPKAAPMSTANLETGSIKGARADDYCANIANPAADARFAWQKKMLADMEQEIAKRIALLEEKTAEYQKWLARRDEFSQKANETVLRIYARMRPDAAAVQLAALDEETAASVLTKLEPRTASLILNEMESTQAVRLTATISGAGKVMPAAAPKTALEAKTK
jgi:flagellar motility protein MotE (MotC chaperone)